jgi:hypothetical protein
MTENGFCERLAPQLHYTRGGVRDVDDNLTDMLSALNLPIRLAKVGKG